MTFAIIRNLFDSNTARAKIADIMAAINVVVVAAPDGGATPLALGIWRLIHATQAGDVSFCRSRF
ncbi:hypothetical protein N2603_42655 [Bradyrhizobium huanghuaihaiense]|uniref:hypothetical protein n=1 Tax=Bradyrhizobium huanghuaihaiense TaxID=990078 RepID=UPI0021AA9E6B|nr:hypothetical protein [Bradyrhizobium sp. CB3035]UWU76502.1 hypothetical protein N2603_42655 [Bradyrhizobium sp. CB3035]